MPIPDRIKFGFADLIIKQRSDLDGRRNVMASAWTDGGMIDIQSSLPESVKARVLFISLHFAVGDISIPAYEAIDRNRIARLMYGILRDNHDLAMLREVSSLRIVGNTWRIQRENEHFKYAAYMDDANQVLNVNSNRRGTRWFHSLLHEVYHVIFDILEMAPDDEDELERVVDSLAWHLVLLLSQNDFSWLIEDDQESSKE